jgi:hypothetical protein
MKSGRAKSFRLFVALVMVTAAVFLIQLRANEFDFESEADTEAPRSADPEQESHPLTIKDPYLPVEVIRERYPNGSVKIERGVALDADGNYMNHGMWKLWNEEGTLVAEGQYDMGERTGAWSKWHSRRDCPSLRGRIWPGG